VVNGRPLRLPDNEVREKIGREKNGFLGIGSPLSTSFCFYNLVVLIWANFYHTTTTKKGTKINVWGV
jgi:hypothetical protein